MKTNAKEIEEKILKIAKGKPKHIKCSACQGTGNVDEAVGFPLDCNVCGGTGWVEV